MTALSSVVGLIPLTIASGLAMKVADRSIPAKKRRAKRVERKLKRKKMSRRVKRVTKSRRSSRQAIDKWIG